MQHQCEEVTIKTKKNLDIKRKALKRVASEYKTISTDGILAKTGITSIQPLFGIGNENVWNKNTRLE